MEKQVNVKMILAVMCAVMIIMLTVAFAHFSRMLKSAGQGKVDPANFDIHFKNLSEPVLHGTAEVTGSPSIATKGVSINNIAVTLKLPGDSVTYTVDIENTGDINVEVSNIEHTNLDNSLLELEVVYTDTGDRLQTGDELQPSEVKNITIKIKYKDIEDPDLLPDQIQTINFSYSVTYTQSNNEALYYASGLPKAYTQLEYLQSTGTQYIDTGIIPTDTIGVYAKYEPVNVTDQTYLGALSSSNSRYYAPYWYDSTTIAYGWNTFNRTTLSKSGSNTIYEVYMNYYNDRKAMFDGIILNSSLPALGTHNRELIMFGCYNQNSINLRKMKIYNIKITNNNTLERNYIPALDPQGRPCMYDTVTGQSYYNNGTGEFLYHYNYSNEETYASGVPKSFTELEYLESTGTQYINTGIIPTDTIGVYAKYEPVNVTDQVYLGALSSSNSRYYAPYWYDSTTIAYGWNTFNRTTLSKSGSNTIYEVYMNYYNDRKAMFDGIILNSSLPALGTHNRELIMFGCYNQNSINLRKMKIYNIKITNNNTLERNYIPALDPNGRPCMYDTVSYTPFYNQGTGEFLYPTSE